MRTRTHKPPVEAVGGVVANHYHFEPKALQCCCSNTYMHDVQSLQQMAAM
jgi:hypothetical protein